MFCIYLTFDRGGTYGSGGHTHQELGDEKKTRRGSVSISGHYQCGQNRRLDRVIESGGVSNASQLVNPTQAGTNDSLVEMLGNMAKHI